MKKKYSFQAVIEREEDGSFYGSVPALKGLHSSGKTVDETIQNVRHAALAYLRSLIKHGDPIPIKKGGTE